MRNEDPMVQALRAWGHAQANRYALSHADRSVHVLDKARDFAPGTKERALRELVGRDGTERRRFMARRSGVDAMHILPTWAVDPIRATNNADRPHDNPEIAVDVGIPDKLRWVERAIQSLARQHPLRACVVRVEFTMSASQKIKARVACESFVEEMAKRLGLEAPDIEGSNREALSTRQYRHELQAAMLWLRGAVSLAA